MGHKIRFRASGDDGLQQQQRANRLRCYSWNFDGKRLALDWIKAVIWQIKHFVRAVIEEAFLHIYTSLQYCIKYYFPIDTEARNTNLVAMAVQYLCNVHNKIYIKLLQTNFPVKDKN